MNSNCVPSYQADMGYSHSELLKELPSAVYPYTVEKVDERTYSISNGMQMAVLELEPEKVRKIASIRIPITRVSISFDNFEKGDYEQFILRFKRYLQRGGG